MEKEEIIETLLLWNFWEKDIDVGIIREEYLTQLERYLDTDEIVILTLDNIWEAYCDYLKPRGRVYLVLDEVQKITGWESWVRAKYDRKEKVKIFVTSSNAELLSSEFATTLTGRHLELSVTPLSFKEFLRFEGIEIETDRLWLIKNKNKLKSLALEYLYLGGFLKIVLTKDELLRKELLSQYFHDILSRDIVNRYKMKNVDKLENLA